MNHWLKYHKNPSTCSPGFPRILCDTIYRHSPASISICCWRNWSCDLYVYLSLQCNTSKSTIIPQTGHEENVIKSTVLDNQWHLIIILIMNKGRYLLSGLFNYSYWNVKIHLIVSCGTGSNFFTLNLKFAISVVNLLKKLMVLIFSTDILCK